MLGYYLDSLLIKQTRQIRQPLHYIMKIDT